MLKIGDKVVMHTCGEAEHYEGQIWTVTSNEWELCGSKVVMLQGFSGAFASEYLQKVNLLEDETDIEKLKNTTILQLAQQLEDSLIHSGRLDEGMSILEFIKHYLHD